MHQLTKILFGSALIALALTRQASATCASYPYTLTNGSTADASQVMANFNCAALTSGATLNSTNFTGTSSFSNSSGNTIVLDKPNGAGQTFSESGALKFLIEDDSIATSELGIYSWGGSSWFNMANFKNNGAFLINTATQPLGSGTRYLVVNGGSTVAAQLYNQSAGSAVEIWNSVSSGTVTHIQFIYGSSGTNLGNITSDGSATHYNTTSDARLKQIDARQRDYRQTIKDLWVGDFHWNKTHSAGFGILAQQAYPLFPSAITKPERASELWEADYGKLAPLALWGVKDLYKAVGKQGDNLGKQSVVVEDLKEKVASQSAEIALLDQKLASVEKRLNEALARN